MKYTKLGNTGVDVSKICLGCMSFGKPGSENGVFPWAKDFNDAKPIFKKAIDLGINYFDTANVYQLGTSEEVTGKLIREFGLNRDEIVVATKVHFEMRAGRPNGAGSSRKNIMAEIDHSLKRLGLDYVDLYQIHRLDHETPMEEIMEALHDVVKSGKARYIGACTMFAWEFERLNNIAEKHNWTKFVSMQNHYNLLYREDEREMIPICRQGNVALTPYSPLAAGRLSRPQWLSDSKRSATDKVANSKYDSTQEQDMKIVERVCEIAEKYNASMSQIAVAWLWAKGVTSPIIGATKPQYFDDIANAVNITLTDEDIDYLEEMYMPHKIVGAL